MADLGPQLVELLLAVDVENFADVGAHRLAVAFPLLKALKESFYLLLAEQSGLVDLTDQCLEFLFTAGLIKLV